MIWVSRKKKNFFKKIYLQKSMMEKKMSVLIRGQESQGVSFFHYHIHNDKKITSADREDRPNTF